LESRKTDKCTVFLPLVYLFPAGGAIMLTFSPLQSLEKLWNLIDKSDLPIKVKTFLFSLVAVSIILLSFGYFLLLKQVVDLIAASLGVSL